MIWGRARPSRRAATAAALSAAAMLLAGCALLPGETAGGPGSSGAQPEHSPLDPEGSEQIEDELVDRPGVDTVEVTHQRTRGDAVRDGERDSRVSYSADIVLTEDATPDQVLELREAHADAFDAAGKEDVEDTLRFTFPDGPRILVASRAMDLSASHVEAVADLGEDFPEAQLRAQPHPRDEDRTVLGLQGPVEVEEVGELDGTLSPLLDELVAFSQLPDVGSACAMVETENLDASVCPTPGVGTAGEWVEVLSDLDALVAPYRPGTTDVRLLHEDGGRLQSDGLTLRVDAEIHDQMDEAERRDLDRIAERAEKLTDGDVELITG